jgi:hypothetical protein
MFLAFTTDIRRQAEGPSRVYCDYRGKLITVAETRSQVFYIAPKYSITALVNRPSTVPSMVPLIQSKVLGIHIGTTYVDSLWIRTWV